MIDVENYKRFFLFGVISVLIITILSYLYNIYSLKYFSNDNFSITKGICVKEDYDRYNTDKYWYKADNKIYSVSTRSENLKLDEKYYVLYSNERNDLSIILTDCDVNKTINKDDIDIKSNWIYTSNNIVKRKDVPKKYRNFFGINY
ncbi:hypothetical protein [Aureibacter tunicatorum]|uniref:Uncharacterized protein n=1 Tax=Aureibacter tunicatorum TaxID=866807 RepID=A0AAE3XSC9_9BACT|nr:hypothetical protein [Aureibacter tunicatorum]MDR6241732.1 hypothetical protein [Aureibacter tunicatorum]BDD07406.1 hypothetical protein AUTU_48890 [Aureibacter tunicatorum]